MGYWFIKKTILTGILMLILCSSSLIVYAEHTKADEYRQIINSGNFYIEYSDDLQNYIVAGKEDARIATVANQYYSDELDYYNGKKDYPNEMYLNGKYYQFTDRRNAVVALETQLYSNELDFRGKWNNIRNRLCIPEEFLPLVTRDPFREYPSGYQAPMLVNSSKKITNNKEFDTDTYSMPLKSHAGTILSETQYVYYYIQDKLLRIETFLIKNGRVNQLSSIKIKQISDVVPETTFSFPKGCKVTAVGVGDMNDLLDQRQVVEIH